MSIIVNSLGYCFPDKSPLFLNLSFSIGAHTKAALIGNNGTGKSALLKIISGALQPSEGTVSCASPPWYVPQHIGLLHKTIADALGVSEKLNALKAIVGGSVSEHDYDTLADDWEIEQRALDALAHWGLSEADMLTPIDRLSGGEKTKVFLAGLQIHRPEVVLLDEPTNHLDQQARMQLYRYIDQSNATMLIVSHDITLLERLQPTYELSEKGIRLFGGNYTFYNEQKEIALKALEEDIHEEEKALRFARKKAQEMRERQERRVSRVKKEGTGIPRILLGLRQQSGENTGAKLREKHGGII